MENASKPRLVIYFNSHKVPLENVVNMAYTDVILAFLITDAQLKVKLSGNLGSREMNQVKTVQQAGKRFLVSFGGGTLSHDVYQQLKGKEHDVAEQIVSIINHYDLDGVDLDYEDSKALMFNKDYNGADFLITLTHALYDFLPEDKRIITHAPQPPYLCAPGPPFDCSPDRTGYVKVLNSVGDKISWLNMQYYNNPPFNEVGNIILNYHQIVNGWTGFNGYPANKLVVGKPFSPRAAGSGYVPVEELVKDVINPLVEEFPGFGGVMGWQFCFDGDGQWSTALGKALKLIK